MQDRIKELAREAGFPSMTVDNMSETDAQRLLKFAQAIARECANIVGDAPMSSYRALEMAQNAILARFGIAKE